MVECQQQKLRIRVSNLLKSLQCYSEDPVTRERKCLMRCLGNEEGEWTNIRVAMNFKRLPQAGGVK